MDNQTTQERPNLAYLRSEVETAEPLKLLVMLYNRLLGELKELRDDLAAGETGEARDVDPKFQKCRDILYHLMESLDPAAGDVSRQLTSMYYYFLQKVTMAQTEKDGRHIDEILPNVETLRQGWLGVVEGADAT